MRVWQTNLLPSELFAQFWADLTFSPINIIPSNSFECRGALNTRLALCHEEFLFPQKIYIYHCLMQSCFYKWHAVFLPCDQYAQFCRVHLME